MRHTDKQSTCDAGPTGICAPDRHTASTLTSQFSGLYYDPMCVSLHTVPLNAEGRCVTSPEGNEHSGLKG